MIKIFLTDDHELVRQGIRALLEREADITFVGEAGNSKDTLSDLATAKPDLLLLDLMLPDTHGMDLLKKAKEALPGLHIIILSMYDNKVYLLEALKGGADGYVIKGSSGAELIKAVRSVMAGRHYVSPSLTEYLMETILPKRTINSAFSTDKLTAREEEVFSLTAEGLTSSDIAKRLGISARTAETHRTNLMKKLGLHNKTELIRYAIERGARTGRISH